MGDLRDALRQIPLLPRSARYVTNPDMAEVHRIASVWVRGRLKLWEFLLVRLVDWIWWPFVVHDWMKFINPAFAQLAAKESGRSMAAHKRHVWLTCVRTGATPLEYHTLALHRARAGTRIGDYLFTAPSNRIYQIFFDRISSATLNRWADKSAFCDYCAAQAIPSARVLAVAESGEVTLREPRESPVWRGDIIMKPNRGSNGAGFYRWLAQSDGTFMGALGEAVSLDAVLAQVARVSRRAPMLVQQRLVNDAVTAGLTGGGLATLRVLTGRDAEGRVEVIGAAMKLPVGAALVDNFQRGNVLAQIDIATGTMVSGQYWYQWHTPIETHPDTGQKFVGMITPQWRECVELALATHATHLTAVIVAFDIAQTPEGPVIVEVNGRGDLAMLQYPGGRPIGDTAYPRIVLSHLRGYRGDRVRTI